VEGFRTTFHARATRTKLSRHTSKTLVISTLASLSVFVGFENRDPTLLTNTILSPSGRAYPDISAQGINFPIIYAGEVMYIDAPVHFSLIPS
jgi:hypothetical protein